MAISRDVNCGRRSFAFCNARSRAAVAFPSNDELVVATEAGVRRVLLTSGTWSGARGLPERLTVLGRAAEGQLLAICNLRVRQSLKVRELHDPQLSLGKGLQGGAHFGSVLIASEAVKGRLLEIGWLELERPGMRGVTGPRAQRIDGAPVHDGHQERLRAAPLRVQQG